jgi:hypothetical protein
MPTRFEKGSFFRVPIKLLIEFIKLWFKTTQFRFFTWLWGPLHTSRLLEHTHTHTDRHTHAPINSESIFVRMVTYSWKLWPHHLSSYKKQILRDTSRKERNKKKSVQQKPKYWQSLIEEYALPVIILRSLDRPSLRRPGLHKPSLSDDSNECGGPRTIGLTRYLHRAIKCIPNIMNRSKYIG